MDKDSQMRRVLFTINNPDEKGISAEEISRRLNTGVKNVEYFCFSKEIGEEEHTPHYHIYAVFKHPKRFSTLKNLFPEAHIDRPFGTHSENRDYVFKTGKWEGTEKESTRIDGTQVEQGELPSDARGDGSAFALVIEQIKDGMSDLEIIDHNPSLLPRLTDIQRYRRLVEQESQKEIFRQIEATYIWGPPGTGKTRGVMEKYGYSNVFRVTDYIHPFDTYEGQDVILFDEFMSDNMSVTDMNNIMDGYPLKLPARYSDKTALFTKVFIISNLELEKQYSKVQDEHPKVWEAFLRRIQTVITYRGMNQYTTQSREEYMKTVYSFKSLPPENVTPFSPRQKKTYRQTSLKLK